MLIALLTISLLAICGDFVYKHKFIRRLIAKMLQILHKKTLPKIIQTAQNTPFAKQTGYKVCSYHICIVKGLPVYGITFMDTSGTICGFAYLSIKHPEINGCGYSQQVAKENDLTAKNLAQNHNA